MHVAQRTELVLALAVLLASSACDDESAKSVLERQREVWNERRPERYVVQVCGTGFNTGCERVAVDGDQVTAAQTSTLARTRWQSIGDPSAHPEPISELFDGALTQKRCVLKELEFDREFGFVAAYYHDCEDEGIGAEVVCFVEGADSLEACDE